MLTVRMLEFEFVLQKDEIPLAFFVGHFLSEGRAERIERSGARDSGSVGEETGPAETGKYAVLFVGVFEACFGRNGPGEVLLGG